MIALCMLVCTPTAAAAPWHFTLVGRLAGVAERDDGRPAVPRGEVGVGGEVWQEGIRCQSLAAGGHASLVAGDEPTLLTGAQWASACLSGRNDEGLDVVILDVRHSLEWDQRPALSMPRSLWQRRYRREEVRLTWAALDITDPASTLHFVALNMRPRVDFVSQGDEAGRATQTTWGVDVMFVGFYDEQPDRIESANFLLLELDGVFDRLSTAVLTFVPAEVRGLVLGNHVALVDGRVFYQNGQQFLSQEGVDEPIDVQSRGLYGADIEVYRRGKWLSGGLRLARSLYPTFDEELAVDTRAAGWVSAQHAAARATLRGFVAHTAVSPPLLPGSEPGPGETTETSDMTGGVALDIRVELDRWLDLGLGIEVARSYYARIDGDRLPAAALGAQALVNAIVRIGHASHPASPLW